MKLGLWHISQKENNNWGTYDSAVVCAMSEEEAKKIHPGNEDFGQKYKTWASSHSLVTARRVGDADETVQAGEIVCASFN